MDIQELKDTILQETLPNVAFDGWSLQSMRDGARSAGLDPDAGLRAFPGGVPELIGHFNDWADRRMILALVGRDIAGMRVRDRVATAVRARLELLAPHREAVRRELAFLAVPTNVPLGLELLYRTVDAVWTVAGDTSLDHNHYTKRGILAGVYGATVLYWLDDPSEGSADTWAFLDRRLDDALRFGRAIGKVPGLGTVGYLARLLPSPVRFARQLRRQVREA